jgi:hypothetical protein
MPATRIIVGDKKRGGTEVDWEITVGEDLEKK